MLIKQRSPGWGRWKPWLLNKSLLTIVGIGALGVVFLVGVFAERKHLTRRAERVLHRNWLGAGVNYLTSAWQAPENLTLDIKHKDYEQLAEWRKLALDRNQITSDLKGYVPGKIRYGDQQFDAELRLKGEWVDHVASDKWSFRVKLKGDQRLSGLKRFSLQHPGTRSFIDEWFYHRVLRLEGVAALRYRFVNVVVNGRDMGLYALEEHFSKQLIENNQRREGVIVRFDADLRYQPFDFTFGSRLVKVPGLLRSTVKAGIGSEHAATVIAYDEERFAQDEQLGGQWKLAYNLLQGFRDGKLATHEVFDIELLANYFAISELTGALWTADDWSDMRFLYNPVTSRLEPISVEGSEYNKIRSLMGAKYTSRSAAPHDLHTLMFQDPQFLASYLAALERVSNPKYLKQRLDDLGDEIDSLTRLLHREWPFVELSTSVFTSNANTIRALLRPARAVQAYETSHAQDELQLEVAAIQPLPVEVTGVTLGGSRFAPREKVILSGIPQNDRADFQQVTFQVPVSPQVDPAATAAASELLIHCKLLGTSREQTVAVTRRPRFDDDVFESNLTRLDGNLEAFEFLEVDATNREVVIPAGEWRVSQNLVVPAGYTLRAQPGAHLTLTNHANLVSYSPLEIQGSEEQPVVIASDPDAPGQGVFVLNTDRRSVLQHVSFRKLAVPRQPGWELTGAVTFYRSDVDLRDCEFLGNDSEDSLNVIHSDLQFAYCTFADAPSDAFDGDFTTGKIRNCKFANVAGDAVDISGSQIEVTDLLVTNIGDKGLSVGEASSLTADGVTVKGANIGAAVKDLSTAVCSHVELTGCEIGFAVFQKKPEYGPGRLTVQECDMTEVAQPYLVETGSLLTVDGIEIEPTQDNAASKLYAGETPPAAP